MNTDTPRTDNNAVCDCDESTGFKARHSVSAEFARQLERELTAEQEKVKRLREALQLCERALEGRDTEVEEFAAKNARATLEPTK